MKTSDLFRFSTDNLRRRLGRTILTVIGVVVGVCAIVVMVSLGIAVNRATDEMLQNWGDLTKVTVYSYGAERGTEDLDDAMVDNFRQIDHVIAATPIYTPEFYGQLEAGRNGRYTGWGNIAGMDPSAVEPMGYKLIAGNYLTEGQYYGKDKIPVLVDRQAVFNFEDTKKNPMSPDRMIYPEYDENDWTKINNLPEYDENGVLLNPESSFFDFMDTSVTYRMVTGYDETSGEDTYKDYEFVIVGMIESGADDYMIMGGFIAALDDVKKMETDYKRLTGSSGGGASYGMEYIGGEGDGNTVQVGGYDQVYVKVDDSRNMPDVEKAIKEQGYQYYSMSQEREQMQGQVAQTQLMLGGLAAVSLFVAALNIANTMTMAIYERTKEIGVMKVLGCKLANIRQMFLIESGAIGLLGGIIGVVISVLLSLILNYLPGLLAMMGLEGSINFAGLFGLDYLGEMMPDSKISIIPVWLVVLALVFATVVGLLSGIAPANRAVKISSLEAIRHE